MRAVCFYDCDFFCHLPNSLSPSFLAILSLLSTFSLSLSLCSLPLCIPLSLSLAPSLLALSSLSLPLSWHSLSPCPSLHHFLLSTHLCLCTVSFFSLLSLCLTSFFYQLFLLLLLYLFLLIFNLQCFYNVHVYYSIWYVMMLMSS